LCSILRGGKGRCGWGTSVRRLSRGLLGFSSQDRDGRLSGELGGSKSAECDTLPQRWNAGTGLPGLFWKMAVKCVSAAVVVSAVVVVSAAVVVSAVDNLLPKSATLRLQSNAAQTNYSGVRDRQLRSRAHSRLANFLAMDCLRIKPRQPRFGTDLTVQTPDSEFCRTIFKQHLKI